MYFHQHHFIGHNSITTTLWLLFIFHFDIDNNNHRTSAPHTIFGIHIPNNNIVIIILHSITHQTYVCTRCMFICSQRSHTYINTFCLSLSHIRLWLIFVCRFVHGVFVSIMLYTYAEGHHTFTYGPNGSFAFFDVVIANHNQYMATQVWSEERDGEMCVCDSNIDGDDGVMAIGGDSTEMGALHSVPTFWLKNRKCPIYACVCVAVWIVFLIICQYLRLRRSIGYGTQTHYPLPILIGISLSYGVKLNGILVVGPMLVPVPIDSTC